MSMWIASSAGQRRGVDCAGFDNVSVASLANALAFSGGHGCAGAGVVLGDGVAAGGGAGGSAAQPISNANRQTNTPSVLPTPSPSQREGSSCSPPLRGGVGGGALRDDAVTSSKLRITPIARRTRRAGRTQSTCAARCGCGMHRHVPVHHASRPSRAATRLSAPACSRWQIACRRIE